MKNKTFLLLVPLVLLGCGDLRPVSNSETEPSDTLPSEPTVALAEHERLLSEERQRAAALQAELARSARAREEELASKDGVIDALELQILELKTNLEAYRKQAKDSKVSLNELKRLGSVEYKEIYERAKTIDNDSAIALYEEFIAQFPDSPIAGKARSQIRRHLAERKVLENRKNAKTLRTWEIKLKGEGLFVREVGAKDLFEVMGRSPDSSKRGSSSEYKQMTYVWRDYVLGQGGAYFDLVIERTDDVVERLSFSE